MTCPHPPGRARLLLGRHLWPATTALVLALAAPLMAQATPPRAKAVASAASGAASSSATPSKGVSSKTAKKKNAASSSSKTTKTSKASPRTRSGSKKSTAKRTGLAPAATGAAASAADPAVAERDPALSGIQLPLMLRVIPTLPDNPAALQSRLDQIVAAQGEGGQGATVGSVRQLGPDIYAFSLHCADAEQCQRLRLAIESERDWVAGLQLDERRHIPRTPDRSSPAAR